MAVALTAGGLRLHDSRDFLPGCAAGRQQQQQASLPGLCRLQSCGVLCCRGRVVLPAMLVRRLTVRIERRLRLSHPPSQAAVTALRETLDAPSLTLRLLLLLLVVVVVVVVPLLLPPLLLLAIVMSP